MIMKSFFSRFWSLIVFARFPLLVLAFFWLFTANLYASCSPYGSSFVALSVRCQNQGYNACGYGSGCSSDWPDLCSKVCANGCSAECPSVFGSGSTLYVGAHKLDNPWCTNSTSSCTYTGYSNLSIRCRYDYVCESQAEADSLNCVLNPGAEGCEDRCSVYNQQCEQLGGVFTGHQTPTGCAASCNTCGTTASKNILEIKIESCCNQGLAPSVERMCITPDLATGDGMQVSSNANLECVDPNLGDDNLNLYVQYCEDNPPGSSNSNQSSSSGGGSSSSGESSSSGDDNNSSASGAGDAYDYYPILDTIRDSLVNIRKNVQNIYTCMITPGTCTGLTPQVTVNVPSDSSFLKNINSTINTTNTLLDSSLRNGNERLKNAIASANDTLIDSLRKFLSSTSSAITVDTLHRIHQSIQDIGEDISQRLGYGDTATATLRDELRGYFTGVEVDTGAVGFANTWVSEGEALGDSLGRAIGWIGGLDTVVVDSVYGRAGWDSSGFDSINGFIGDTLGGILDSLHLQLKKENDSIKGSLPDSLTVWADSLIKVSPFVSFDSLIYSTIGARIPNSDNCPEDCQSWSLNLPRFGLINYTVDFGLCLGRVPLGGMNVLGFLKLLIRLVIVWTCISIVMWTFSHRKM